MDQKYTVQYFRDQSPGTVVRAEEPVPKRRGSQSTIKAYLNVKALVTGQERKVALSVV